MDLGSEIERYLNDAYREWQQGCERDLRDFSNDLNIWVRQILDELPRGGGWRSAWQQFAASWEARGMEINDASELHAYLDAREREVGPRQALRHDLRQDSTHSLGLAHNPAGAILPSLLLGAVPPQKPGQGAAAYGPIKRETAPVSPGMSGSAKGAPPAAPSKPQRSPGSDRGKSATSGRPQSPKTEDEKSRASSAARGALTGGARSVAARATKAKLGATASSDNLGQPQWSAKRYSEWFKSLPTRPASGDSPAKIFQRQVAGPLEYHVQGANGEWFWLDGIEGTTAIEAKAVVNARSSPQLGTASPFFEIRFAADVDDKFGKISNILRDTRNPLVLVEVRVKTADAKPYWEAVLARLQIPGRVVAGNERSLGTAARPLVPGMRSTPAKPGLGLAKGIALGIVASLAEAGVAKEVYKENAALLEDLLKQLSDRTEVDEAGWVEIGRRLKDIQNMTQSTLGGIWEFITYGQNSILENKGIALGLLAHELAQKYGYDHSRGWSDIVAGRPGRFFKAPQGARK